VRDVDSAKLKDAAGKIIAEGIRMGGPFGLSGGTTLEIPEEKERGKMGASWRRSVMWS